MESASQRYVGVVCSMKDTFGFIERADIVKEIFFHYSEFKGDISELILGDDVSFGVQIRNVSSLHSLKLILLNLHILKKCLSIFNNYQKHKACIKF